MKHYKTYKPILCLFFAFIMMIITLTGCTDNTGGTTGDTKASVSESVGETAFSYSDGIDANGFWEGIKALDYVEIFNYKAMTIPNNVHQISDNDLQSAIDQMLDEYSSSKQVKDRAVADGDTVNIDYVGSVDGVEFEGGSTGGSGTEVTAGSPDYIDDFLTQIIGHKPGETINVKVTFPNDYGKENLNGKNAVFVTTINYIVEKVAAELTDKFVKENLSAEYGWKTVKEMKKGKLEELQKEAIQKHIKEYMTNDVTVKSIPEQLTSYQEKAMLKYYQETAMYYSMELDEFLSSYEGVSNTKELIEKNRENNSKSARYYLVNQAIAEDAGISVSDEDLTNYFTKYTKSSDYSSYKEQYGLPYLKQIVLCQKVIDVIIKNAVLL